MIRIEIISETEWQVYFSNIFIKARSEGVESSLFEDKISVFDLKNHFNYVKYQENHISLKFKMSAG